MLRSAFCQETLHLGPSLLCEMIQVGGIPLLKALHVNFVGGYDRERAIASLKGNHADLICMGRHFLANPDLPRRWREDAPLNKYNRDTFYSQGNQGYIDYPFLDGVPESAKKFLG